MKLKKKKGHVTQKKIYDLKIDKPLQFSLNSAEKLLWHVKNNIINIKKNLFPILSTHYTRDYFLSSNNKIRATLDFNFRNSILYGYQNLDFLRNNKNFIIEMKYNKDYDNFVKSNIEFISARLSKSSKYFVSAMENSKIYGL